ncbi:hypothetical protein HYPSUDRAFT_47193 [Hypholoma sublateritium FD-334 SS-4]|uniref:Uncharacterized protein n=1 Tax=Hypholoma sublateritium (strain FD-334 SS-4) TaxID=945553 RepID=A0A0D2M047_HYPSF|nr:hypothetical protein HYPSUDRAFT_47193 [Hypholoma sublateritium FD-334 SS-4]
MLRAVDYKDSAPMYGYRGQWYITITTQAEKAVEWIAGNKENIKGRSVVMAQGWMGQSECLILSTEI